MILLIGHDVVDQIGLASRMRLRKMCVLPSQG